MKKNLMVVLMTMFIYLLILCLVSFATKTKAEILKVNNTKPGIVEMFFNDNVPEGYLLCDGRAVSRTTYSNLFKAIGTTYGVGDGSTTFNLPNMQGRTVVGKNTETFNQIGKTGGEEKHVLVTKEIASHNHSVSSGTVSTKELKGQIWNLVYQDKTYMGAASGVIKKGVGWLEGAMVGGQGAVSNIDPGFTINLTHNHTLSGNTSSIGSSEGHNNLQPYIVANYIIKY